MREEVQTFLVSRLGKSFTEQKIQGAGNRSNYSGPQPMDLDAFHAMMQAYKGKGKTKGGVYLSDKTIQETQIVVWIQHNKASVNMGAGWAQRRARTSARRTQLAKEGYA